MSFSLVSHLLTVCLVQTTQILGYNLGKSCLGFKLKLVPSLRSEGFLLFLPFPLFYFWALFILYLLSVSVHD